MLIYKSFISSVRSLYSCFMLRFVRVLANVMELDVINSLGRLKLLSSFFFKELGQLICWRIDVIYSWTDRNVVFMNLEL
jgi:hypothetical protein